MFEAGDRYRRGHSFDRPEQPFADDRCRLPIKKGRKFVSTSRRTPNESGSARRVERRRQGKVARVRRQRSMPAIVPDLSGPHQGRARPLAQEMTSNGKLTVEPTKDADKAAYVLDEIACRKSRPTGRGCVSADSISSPMATSAALCTWNGDVYIVKGIDDKLDHLTWRRIAGGMFQTLGLKIIDGNIYVHGRDQITILHDLERRRRSRLLRELQQRRRDDRSLPRIRLRPAAGRGGQPLHHQGRRREPGRTAGSNGRSPATTAH